MHAILLSMNVIYSFYTFFSVLFVFIIIIIVSRNIFFAGTEMISFEQNEEKYYVMQGGFADNQHSINK